MANNLFAKYLWEISTIERAGRITLRSLSEKWQRCHLGFNEELPRRTFDNHREKIKELSIYLSNAISVPTNII